jgi:hypothetical protein
MVNQILQNELLRRLPAEFINSIPEGVQVAYAVIPQIKHLHEPVQTIVRTAFAESVNVIWKVLLGFAAVGFLSNL